MGEPYTSDTLSTAASARLIRWWNNFIDRWVRLKSRTLPSHVLYRRKALHIALVVAAIPLHSVAESTLTWVLVLSCAFTITAQRRIPYASLSLLILVHTCYRWAVVGAWVVFTVGDGLSGLIGRFLQRGRLPWSRHRTWTGTCAFVLGAFCSLAFVLRALQIADWALLALAASASAALAETVDGIDDNCTTLIVPGLVLQFLGSR